MLNALLSDRFYAQETAARARAQVLVDAGACLLRTLPADTKKDDPSQAP